MSGKSPNLLSWTHYRVLLQVSDKQARDWYEKEAASQMWSVRTLQRNVSSQYYYRILKTQKKDLVEKEMKRQTAAFQQDKLEFIKNPVITEFLGFSMDSDYTESDLLKKYSFKPAEISDGAWKRLCFCGKAATYSYGETGLLY